ncbi:glycoside hydrolase, partial [Aureobasidium melanogenum]
MRSTMLSAILLSTLAGLGSVHALALPQDIDLAMVEAAPDPTYTIVPGLVSQVVTVNTAAILAEVTAAASSQSIAVSDAASTGSVVAAKRNVQKRSACAPQPTGVSSYAVHSPDKASAFVANAVFASVASAAAVPSGYVNTFTNLDASTNGYGYLGYSLLDSYDTRACAANCNKVSGCLSFNILFQRDPSVDPGSGATGCEDPASVTHIKCVLWGGPTNLKNTVNTGSTQNSFAVVIAGSNGYQLSNLTTPDGFALVGGPGESAINAPYDSQGYNTFMGSTIFTKGGFDLKLCSDYCQAQTTYNVKHPASDGSPPKICHFFNTYILYLNNASTPQGQYCSLYTEVWDYTKYATNSGQYRGSDHYFIGDSYTFANKTSAGPSSSQGDQNGAIHQAVVDMKYTPSSLSSVFLPFCTSVLKSSSASTPAVLTKYPATVVASACSLVTTTATSSSPSSSTASSTTSSVAKSISTSSATQSTSTSSATQSTSTSSASGTLKPGQYTDWKSFKANGANLGNWLEIEFSNDQYFFESNINVTADRYSEEDLCTILGDRCPAVLNGHYSTYITHATIDKLATVGVNFLRIPTTYAAWVDVPGSALYHGDQQAYLRDIAEYAITAHGMRVVVGLHSLPGGANAFDTPNPAWFYNSTYLDYTYVAVQGVLDFIQASPNPWAYTFAPLNEVFDNPAGFASGNVLTTAGTEYIVKYVNGCFDLIAKTNPSVPLMLQDCFAGMTHWTPYFDASRNMVIDTHIYYFAAAGIYAGYVKPTICGQGSAAPGDGKFPVFIGEWSLQTLYNNTLDGRESIFNTQRYAWSKYVQGGSFWTANFNGTDPVDGEGVQKDYWDYIGLIDAGVIKPVAEGVEYC